MRYTAWDPGLGRWVVQCLHKPEGGQIKFYIFEEPAEVIENNKGKIMLDTPPVLKVYGEAIDRLAELENQKETDRKTTGAYEDRLRHLLRSKTVQLFDEHDPKTRTYKRDIRRLDTYGVDKEVLEFERKGSNHTPPYRKGTLPPPPTKKPEAENTRPCEVDGKSARFHRWVDMDVTLLQVDSWSTREDIDEILNLFKEKGVAPANAHINTCRNVFALVEYDDGTVGKVEPEKVKFTDRRTAE